MIQEQTKRYIDAMSDEQVYVYASDSAGTYAEEAVAYAREVLARRGITAERVVELQAAKARQLWAAQQERGADLRRPLSRRGRVGFFVLGMMGIPFIVAMKMYMWRLMGDEEGTPRRFREAIAAMGAGFAVMVGIVVGVVGMRKAKGI